ncbi:MAG: hypothetical protein AAB365_01355 [Patescibacteria group bacterium]
MLYPIDENGCVINEASADKVQGEYIPLVADVLSLAQTKLTTNLRSVYIRGSVSVGRAVPGISDLDSVIVVYHSVSAAELAWFSQEARLLEKKYPHVTFVDITVLTLDQILTSKEYSNLKIYLKTQSYIAYGEDILMHIADVKPGPDLARRMYAGLREECADLRNVISGDGKKTYLGEEKTLAFWCVWNMRVLLRSGLGLVMFETPVYSQDLETCYAVFSTAYPEYAGDMAKALQYAMNPISDKTELISFLDRFVPSFLILWDVSLKKYE